MSINAFFGILRYNPKEYYQYDYWRKPKIISWTNSSRKSCWNSKRNSQKKCIRNTWSKSMRYKNKFKKNPFHQERLRDFQNKLPEEFHKNLQKTEGAPEGIAEINWIRLDSSRSSFQDSSMSSCPVSSQSLFSEIIPGFYLLFLPDYINLSGSLLVASKRSTSDLFLLRFLKKLLLQFSKKSSRFFPGTFLVFLLHLFQRFLHDIFSRIPPGALSRVPIIVPFRILSVFSSQITPEVSFQE